MTILAARYVLPISSEPLEHGAIVIKDNTITDVGFYDEIKRRYPDEPVEDYGLAALMPGFVDCHTHLDHAIMRGIAEDLPYGRWKSEIMKAEALMDPGDWETSALLGALEATVSGITTIADMTLTGATALAIQRVGLRAIIYREVGTMDKSRVDESMDTAIADIEAWRDYTDSTRVEIGIAPYNVYSCHPELFRKVADYAADGTPVAMHLASSGEEYDFVKYGSSRLAVEVRDQYSEAAPLWLPTGVSPVRYVLQYRILDAPNVLAVHVTQVDALDIVELEKRDVAIAYCPRTNAKLGMGIAPVREFAEAHLRVGLGTDSPAAANRMDMFSEMRTGLLMQRARYAKAGFLSATEMLRTATLDGARALKMDDIIGSLEVGKQADLIAIDLSRSAQVPTHDPAAAIVHSSYPNDVFLTMVAGEVIYRRDEWVRVDGDDVKAASEDIRLKLRDR
ncbi:MAG: amidohydrolase family protein [Coriobacteriia bacterium]|nr:amidohydrolase family protein [Coriobacteriia bacterium]